MKENEKKGTLWRPIKRLMAKARYVREMQKISGPGERYARDQTESTFTQTFGGDQMPSVSTSTTSGCTRAADGMNDMQSVLGIESLNPFMELFPDDGMDVFAMMQDYNNGFP